MFYCIVARFESLENVICLSNTAQQVISPQLSTIWANTMHRYILQWHNIGGELSKQDGAEERIRKRGVGVDARKREFAERYRTGAMWPESVSSSSVHQLQYTHSDDAWKSIYATSRERRQHRDGGREIQRVDWRIDVSILLVSGQNQTTEKVKFHSKSQQFTFRFSNLSHPQTLII